MTSQDDLAPALARFCAEGEFLADPAADVEAVEAIVAAALSRWPRITLDEFRRGLNSAKEILTADCAEDLSGA